MRSKNQISSAEYKRKVAKQGKEKSKHRNIRTEHPIYGKFDSIGEMNRFLDLVLLEKSNQISDLKRQVRFELFPKTDKFRKIEYVADFTYFEKGEYVVEDFKNPYLRKRDGVYKIKKKMMYGVHGVMVKETS